MNMDTEQDNLMEYRVKKLEDQYAELRHEIKSITEILMRLDKKLAGIPEGGLQCQIHSLQMSEIKDKLEKHDIMLEGFSKMKWKLIGAVSVASAIFSLLSPMLADKMFKPSTSQRIEITIPGLSTNHFATK